MVASAGHDGMLALCDATSGTLVFKELAHSSMISSIKYIPSKGCMITGGWDSNLKIWSLTESHDEKGQLYSDFKMIKSFSVTTPILNILVRQMLGSYVVIIGANNSLKVWNIET